MAISARRPGRPRPRAIPILAAAAALLCAPVSAKDPKLAQLLRYTASGTHQCGADKGRSCVVTGSGFTNCNDASISLQTRDCCPTTRKGGTSSSFTLNYCIPDRVP